MDPGGGGRTRTAPEVFPGWFRAEEFLKLIVLNRTGTLSSKVAGVARIG
jgi:hypothetical protein